jgi:hypothetical protein
MFKVIIENTKSPKALSLAKNLVKSFSPKSKNDLENLTNLVFWLYIYDEKAYCKSICSILNDFELSGNPDLDTWVRYVNLLYSRLLREEGNIEDSKKYVEKVLLSYQEKPKPLRRILNGEDLYDDKINTYLNENNIEKANAWRFLQYNKLCFIRELGGSETCPIEYIEKNMKDIKDILNKK